MSSKDELINKLKYGSYYQPSATREVIKFTKIDPHVVNMPLTSRYGKSSVLVIKDSRSSAYIQTYEPWDGIDMRAYDMNKNVVQRHKVRLRDAFRADLLSNDYFQNPDLYWWILYSNNLFDDTFFDTDGKLINKVLIIKNYYNQDNIVS